MTYYDYLCRLLEPMRVYRTERGTLSGGELYAAGKALDKADGAMEYAEQEGLLQTAEGEGLARREKLFSRCPVSVSTALRREAIAALARIILDIIPCHLLVEFYFRYLTWLECERVGFTWQSVEDAHHTWESFEKAVPEEE